MLQIKHYLKGVVFSWLQVAQVNAIICQGLKRISDSLEGGHDGLSTEKEIGRFEISHFLKS